MSFLLGGHGADISKAHRKGGHTASVEEFKQEISRTTATTSAPNPTFLAVFIKFIFRLL